MSSSHYISLLWQTMNLLTDLGNDLAVFRVDVQVLNNNNVGFKYSTPNMILPLGTTAYAGILLLDVASLATTIVAFTGLV